MARKEIKRFTFSDMTQKSVIQGIMIVLVAALTIEGTSLLELKFAQNALKREALLSAQSSMQETKDRIMEVVTETEAALRNSVWIAQWSLYETDSLKNICKRIVQDNPTINGSSVALVPGYSKRKPLMAPFAYRDENGEVLLKSLATEEYDYPSHEWFKAPLEKGRGHWSEPYYDKQGSGNLVVTYSIPVPDRDGEYGAVITADVSLEWLYGMMESDTSKYPGSFGTLVSHIGTVMQCPVDSLIMSSTVWDFGSYMKHPAGFDKLANDMVMGETGMVQIQGTQDKTNYYVYYAPVQKTGWSMSIVIPEAEIFKGLKNVVFIVILLQVLGLAMLIIIFRRVLISQMEYNEAEEKKKSMESELRIGHDIQMSMIPKAYPPFPDRTDIDLAAVVVPAKEVGGDLYDFYIRDEKLFFCIGDVSGKGVPASMVMAVTRSLFRNVSAHESNPARIVTAINDSLADENENDMFVTFFLGILDLRNGQLDYCNAGHNAPFIMSDKVRRLEVTPNVPLGVLPGMSFTGQQTRLGYDDALFLFTDGVTEAENTHHQLFGDARTESVLHMRREPRAHLAAMQEAIAAFVGNAPQSDDITMLFIHYLPELKDGALPTERRLELHNDIQQIPQLAGFMEDVARDAGLETSMALSLNLALEEAVTNVILYAYPKGTDGLVDIEAIIRDNRLDFVLTDSGKAFDPTAAPEADITLGVEERAIGGLGIHLVRKIMDNVRYERIDGKNIFTMTKNL